MYARITPENIDQWIEEAEGNNIEFVDLKRIVTNYPIPIIEGEYDPEWEPVLSEDSYVMLAKPMPLPPENELDLEEMQYIHENINRYAGAKMPQ